MENNTNAYTVSTLEMFTPNHDPHTREEYTGSHRDFRIILHRNGDTVLYISMWTVGESGTYENGMSAEIDLADMLNIVRTSCEDAGREFNVVDDLPQGFTEINTPYTKNIW